MTLSKIVAWARRSPAHRVIDCYTFYKYTKDQSAPFDAAMFVDAGGLGAGSYRRAPAVGLRKSISGRNVIRGGGMLGWDRREVFVHQVVHALNRVTNAEKIRRTAP